MIDWTKPIETMEDGTPARVLGLLSLSMASSPLTPDADGFEPMMVWVKSDRNGGWGNIFLVNNQGYRCDDRALFSARQEPFIRNVRVKREGWVHVRRGTSLLGDYRIFSTETDARKAASFSEQVVRMEWEE